MLDRGKVVRRGLHEELITTIMDADRIYVLDAGEMVEEGTYEELMARNGIFGKLARRQII